MNINGPLKRANFKKLTLSGLLVASLFAGSIDATKMAYTAGGTLIACAALNRFIATIGNATAMVDAMKKYSELSKRELSIEMLAKQQAGYQLAFYLNRAGFIINGLTTAAAAYISYLSLKEAFAAPEVTQKDKDQEGAD